MLAWIMSTSELDGDANDKRDQWANITATLRGMWSEGERERRDLWKVIFGSCSLLSIITAKDWTEPPTPARF